jgi:hypothetical protein
MARQCLHGTGGRIFETHDQLSVDGPDRESGQAQPACARHAPCAQVEAQTVRRAAQHAPLEMTACERSSVMGTRIVDSMDRAVDVKQNNAAAIDENPFSLASREFIDRSNRYLT